MDIVFVQTADPGVYHDMMLITARTVRAYCARQGHSYEAYVGVRRGYWPWQATFNRIYLLQELVARGRHDWAVYMDADAFVSDLAFDLPRYLARKANRAAVMVRSGATREAWDVNAGVLMLNLRHPFTARLLAAWRAAYEAIPDATLRAQSTWSNPNDQEMLQAFLREDPEAPQAVHLAPRKLINSAHARFIRQLLGAHFPDPAERLRALEARVGEALGADRPPGQAPDSPRDAAAASAVVDLIYRGVLRRQADPQGLRHFAPLVEQLGFESSVRLMLQQLLDSEEYASRVLAPREPPRRRLRLDAAAPGVPRLPLSGRRR